MAARMKYMGVKAALVNGRVRDLAELQASGLNVCKFFFSLLIDYISYWSSSRSGPEQHQQSAPAQKPNQENATFR
jgi:hypothetical protein